MAGPVGVARTSNPAAVPTFGTALQRGAAQSLANLCTANFELGTPGATIATGDSGNATPWDTVQIGSGALLTYDSTVAYGAQSAKFDKAGTTVVDYLAWQASFAPSGLATAPHYGRLYLYMTANPATAVRVCSFFQSVVDCSIRITATGKVAVVDAGNTALATSAASISLNQWVRLEWRVEHHPTTGQMTVRLFNSADSLGAPTETVDSGAVMNTGIGATSVRFGDVAGVALTTPFWLDGIVAGATDTYPAPLSNIAAGVAASTAAAYGVKFNLVVDVGAASSAASAYGPQLNQTFYVGAASSASASYGPQINQTLHAGAASSAASAFGPQINQTLHVGQAVSSATAYGVKFNLVVDVGKASSTATAFGATPTLPGTPLTLNVGAASSAHSAGGPTFAFGPNRGSGTTAGWVHPVAVQDRNQLRRRDTGAVVRMLGTTGGQAIPFVEALAESITVINGNTVALHAVWPDCEPNRPTGGNPNTNPPTWTSRDYTGNGMLAAYDTFLTWCDANGIMVILCSSGSHLADYFGSTQHKVPTWLYDDSKWSGSGFVAPLPFERWGGTNSLGGPYPANSNGEAEALGAEWTLSTNTLSTHTRSPNVTYHGDATILQVYALDWIKQLVTLGSKHPSVVGYKPWNEPGTGVLSKSENFGSNGGTAMTESVLRTLKPFYDSVRAFEPERFICFTGMGGNNYNYTPDFSYLWSAGGSRVACPADHPFVHEIHWYSGGFINPTTGAIVDAATDSQSLGAPNPLIYDPHRDGQGFADYEEAFVDQWWTANQAWNVPLYFGEWNLINPGAVANYANYYTDMRLAFDRYNLHLTQYGGLGISVNDGLFSLVSGSYVLNATSGPLVAAYYASTPHGNALGRPESHSAVFGPQVGMSIAVGKATASAAAYGVSFGTTRTLSVGTATHASAAYGPTLTPGPTTKTVGEAVSTALAVGANVLRVKGQIDEELSSPITVIGYKGTTAAPPGSNNYPGGTSQIMATASTIAGPWVLSGDGSMQLPLQTNAARPPNAALGAIAWNTLFGQLEANTGSAWTQLGGPPDGGWMLRKALFEAAGASGRLLAVNFDPALASGPVYSGPTSGVTRYYAVYWPGGTMTGMAYLKTVAGAYTDANSRSGTALYKSDGTTLTRVAHTTSQLTESVGLRKRDWGTFDVLGPPPAGIYYVAIRYVQSTETTAPIYAALVTQDSSSIGGDVNHLATPNNWPLVFTQTDASQVLPATQAISGLTAGAGNLGWIGLY